MIAALQFKVNEDYSAFIYPVSDYNKVDWNHPRESSLGFAYQEYDYKSNNTEEKYCMDIADGLDDNKILRLIETKRYIIKLKGNGEKHQKYSLPMFQNEGNKFFKCDKDEESATFQFINYLGRSKITFINQSDRLELPFEVVPDKMSYEDDYISLTEALAERCAEILLDYSGSTSNLYSMSDNDSETLLEQFIFLRQFCFSENIQALFEEIKRNPDRILIEDEEFRPFGQGRPSKKVYSNPFKYANNWIQYSSENSSYFYLPSEVVVSHKKDNLDTSANRFLKYALEFFDSICIGLIEKLNLGGARKQTQCRIEAKVIHEMIDEILRDHFFDGVGALSIVPQNNQVLQKREGYHQIFTAYSMIDLALQLDWKGKDSIYEGESKNVALLYEYWLFFELAKVINSIDGCCIEKEPEDAFISSSDGLAISLQEGKRSCQYYIIPNKNIKINLYYNRTFSYKDFQNTYYEGSYSRPFRPDYTIAIFPSKYTKGKGNGENEAVRDGQVSYIHFDAKYRINDISVFTRRVADGSEEEKREIEQEKNDEITNTYKRGDLLKMHTYNDAIRRTIGSYVLYPGDGNISIHNKNVFSLYDEILPGVGAFAVKPSNSSIWEEELKSFISSLIFEKASQSSRLNRMKYYSEMVIRDPASSETVERRLGTGPTRSAILSPELCVIGYMRADLPEDYYNYLLNSELLKQDGEFYFYYYAIKDGFVYTHHADLAKASILRIYTNKINKDNEYILEPFVCSIQATRLISKADLVKRLSEIGYITSEDKHHADFYYIMKVKVIDDSVEQRRIRIRDVNSMNGNDSVSPHSPKVLTIGNMEF